MPAPSPDLVNRYRRNRATLIAINPRLEPLLGPESPIPPASARLTSAGREIENIDLGAAGQFYPGPARSVANAQITDLLRGEGRFRTPVHLVPEDDQLLHETATAIDHRLPSPIIRTPAAITFPPRLCPTVCLFGLGLGYQLEVLSRLADVHHLIIYEPTPLFLSLSLWCADWPATIRAFNRDTGTLAIVTEPDGRRAGEIIWQIIIERLAPTHLTGALPVRHYGAPPIDEAIDYVNRRLPIAVSSRGYYKDQRRQLAQALTSLPKANGFLKASHPEIPKADLFVVGAGPSLETTLPALASIRPHGMLVTCGSALRPVVHAGLVPDLHVELETAPSTLNVIEAIGRPELLHTIPLATSTGIPPDVTGCFAKTFMFQRWGSAGQFMGDIALSLHHADPFVGNTALALGYALGFRRIFLFGVDFGFRDVRHHHARGTIYFKDGEGEARTDYLHIGVDEPVAGYDQASGFADIPSIDGGFLKANMLFLYSLRSAEALIRSSPGLEVVQCGNGARVHGATNIGPEALAGIGFERQGVETATIALSRFVACDASSVDVTEPLKRLIGGVATAVRDLAAIASPAPTDVRSVLLASQRSASYLLGDLRKRSPGVSELITGNVLSFYQIALERLLMLPNERQRRNFLDIAFAAYRNLLSSVATDSAALSDRA
ncbi:MAG: DUF115 domain-containing protein [Rhodospirillaceae bacterium]|nr:DUF115 domain-containing protein [Rhodospirillaceae bacterium]